MATAPQTAAAETRPLDSRSSAISNARVIWVAPSLSRGRFMQPLFAEFAKLFPNSVVFTGLWPGFISGYENSFLITLLKGVRFRVKRSHNTGNPRGFSLVPPGTLLKMWRAKPDLIFVRGFDLCTLYGLLIKVLTRCRVVLFWGGAGPHVDYLDSPSRLRLRRALAGFFDYSVSHTTEGARYLRQIVRIPERKLLQFPYQPAVRAALLGRNSSDEPTTLARQRPVFLYVGRLIREKGLYVLLEACVQLERQHPGKFTVLVVGNGPERDTLETAARVMEIDHCIEWAGAVDYERLGAFYKACDVFVFPTFEDVIGMVVPEAMVFGKAVLCSSRAGACDMVRHGENGFVFDPSDARQLAEYMTHFIRDPNMVFRLGRRSAELIAPYSPETLSSRLACGKDPRIRHAHYER